MRKKFMRPKNEDEPCHLLRSQVGKPVGQILAYCGLDLSNCPRGHWTATTIVCVDCPACVKVIDEILKNLR